MAVDPLAMEARSPCVLGVRVGSMLIGMLRRANLSMVYALLSRVGS